MFTYENPEIVAADVSSAHLLISQKKQHLFCVAIMERYTYAYGPWVGRNYSCFLEEPGQERLNEMIEVALCWLVRRCSPKRSRRRLTSSGLFAWRFGDSGLLAPSTLTSFSQNGLIITPSPRMQGSQLLHLVIAGSYSCALLFLISLLPDSITNGHDSYNQ